MFNLINRFTVSGDVDKFEQLLGELTDYMTQQPGFRSHRCYRSAQDAKVYIETAEWDDAAAHRQAMSGPGFMGPVQEVMKLATVEPGAFELLSEHRATVSS